MRAPRGSFHADPDCARWRRLSAFDRNLSEIFEKQEKQTEQERITRLLGFSRNGSIPFFILLDERR